MASVPISTVSSGVGRRGSRPGLTLGLEWSGFNKQFDDHFEVRSEWIGSALCGSRLEDDEAHARCTPIRSFLDQPQCWGIRVRSIWKLWQFISDDLQNYSRAHMVTKDFRHVCLASDCTWKHHCAVVTAEEAEGELQELRANMHLVVERYVKPWTQPYEKAGLALCLNAGHLADRRGRTAVNLCKAQIFISHTWSEDFEDFAGTVNQTMDPERVVWVCSLGIWQHGNIASSLSSVEECPFARAMRHCSSVVVVTDTSGEALERCWCVLEAKLAQNLGLDYSISLPDDEDEDMWKKVVTKLHCLDVRNCRATRDEDKEHILEYARMQEGGIDAVNDTVRKVAMEAAMKAELMSATREGDLEKIQQLVSVEALKDWRTIRRQRTLTHIATMYSCVQAMHQILEWVDYAHLDTKDTNGQTPLHLASQTGALAAAQALLQLSADPLARCNCGLSPLHLACAGGHRAIAQVLIRSRAAVNAVGCYTSAQGHTPLSCAVREGFSDMVWMLVKERADPNVFVCDMPVLTMATIQGHTDAVAMLLAAKAEVNTPGTGLYGKTPLMCAVQRCRVAVAAVLLAAKACPQARDKQGRTLRDYCLDCQRTDPESMQQLEVFLGPHAPLLPAAAGRDPGGGRLASTLPAHLATPAPQGRPQSAPAPLQRERQIVDAFRRCDKDGSGQVPRGVLEQVLLQLMEPRRLSPSELAELLAAAGVPPQASHVDYSCFTSFLCR